MLLTIIFIYLGLVLGIGVLSHRLFRGTGEDYFVATRTIGPFVLLMSLFGTNMTAFAILGASGESYHSGIGVFGLMASSSALVIPSVFFFVGTKVWAWGKKFGYLTQVQLIRDRWGSDGLGLLLFSVLMIFIIPYLLIGVMGGGITMSQITKGAVPEWLGGLIVCLVVLMYVTYGGLRGTAWANTFQTLVFMTLGGVTYYVIVSKMGGLSHAMSAVSNEQPELLIRGDLIKPLKLLTYLCIPLSAGMFPHLFMHWLSAKSAACFRIPVIFYPICMVVVWIPSVTLGVLGSVDFPGLQGPAANSVLVQMIGLYAPDVLAGLLAAGVFAAVMSSLDSQVLAIGTMFTQDIALHYGFHDRMGEKQQVLFGRIFVCAILLVTYIIFLVSNTSIFKLAVWSFSGFAALLPVGVAALYWKRSTKHGAMTAIISVIGCWAYFIMRGWDIPNYTVGGTGIMPVAVILGISTATMIIVSLMTQPPDRARVDRFFPSTAHDPSLSPVRQREAI
jgi:SSS family solute:Na+ symporter